MSAPTGAKPGPTPERFFGIVNAYQQSAALKAAIELGFFTAVAEGHNTAEKAAARCKVSLHGARILCDYLTIMGFLHKEGGTYRLAEDAALFLDKNSRAYLGGCIEFLLSPQIKGNFDQLTDRVRQGGSAVETDNTVSEANTEVWVRFARGMAGLMAMPAQILAQHVLAGAPPKPMKVLDIAAGHGMFGIAVGQQNPQARVTGVDWGSVLAVAKENATRFGIGDRYDTINGSAFEQNLGTDYDLVLVPNFLHHFDRATNLTLLKRIHGALKPGGRVAVLEFAPNEDRVTPPQQAGFALVMLAGTPSGDAYTVTELQAMLQETGFKDANWKDLPNTLQRVIVGTK